MGEEVITSIIRQCLRLDTAAVAIYGQMAENASESSFKKYWSKMAADEGEHVLFWKKLLVLSRDGIMPQVFDRPYEVLAELKEVARNVTRLKKESAGQLEPGPSLLLCLQLEFHLLHQAFATLFNYARYLEEGTGLERTVDEYDSHVNGFFRFLCKYKELTPELRLLGDALCKLWQRNRELAAQISSDALTGTLNRRGFMDAIGPIAHLSQRDAYHVGVLFVDIDDFKKVNDNYGHRTGDEVLAGVAGVITANLRRSDIVGRYGGEEFVAFLSRVEPGYVSHIAQKIRNAVASEMFCGIRVTVSIGGVQGIVAGGVEESVKDLIALADQCMYRAKEKGKNRVVTKRYEDEGTERFSVEAISEILEDE